MGTRHLTSGPTTQEADVDDMRLMIDLLIVIFEDVESGAWRVSKIYD